MKTKQQQKKKERKAVIIYVLVVKHSTDAARGEAERRPSFLFESEAQIKSILMCWLKEWASH